MHSHEHYSLYQPDTEQRMARIIRVRALEELSEESSSLKEDVYDDAHGHCSLGRIAQRATDELKQYFNCTRSAGRRRPIGKLLFYRLVKEGNVAAVSRILDDLKDSDPFLHTVILLGEAEARMQSQQNPDCLLPLDCNSCSVLSVIYLFILLPICVLLTPIFYIVHSWTHNSSARQGMSRDVKLPLLFAALSSNFDMVRVFLERHSNILKASDEFGCNVFHYLADLSCYETRSANSCFAVLFRVFGSNKIRNVLLKEKNVNGLSGLEFAVMVGSPVYFTRVLEFEGVLKKTEMIQRSDQIYFNSDVEQNEGEFSLEESARRSSSYALSRYDVSMYEGGDVFQDQSFLLTLLSARELLDMSDEEIACIENCSFLKNWIQTKLQVNSFIASFAFCVNLILLVILCFYISHMSASDERDSLLVVYWTLNQQMTTKMDYQQVNGSKCFASAYNFKAEDTSTACKLNEACGRDANAKLNATVESEEYAKFLSLVNVFVSALVVVFDAIFRFAFLGIRMFCRNEQTNNASAPVLARRVFTRRIQASYVTRQLNILSGVFLLMMAWLRFCIDRLNIDGFATAVTKSMLMSTMKANVALSALFRALEIIYYSRLRTAGGHFVISMCKIGKVLRQFMVVYCLMASMLSLVFLYAVVNPSCPLKKLYPFEDMSQAMLGTFWLLLGDNRLPDPMSLDVLVTYVAYLVMANVVMMSLLTGLAGSVADRVVSRQLKDMIMMIERLEESIDVETTLLLAVYPFRRAVHRWRYGRATSTTTAIVKSVGNGREFQMFIEVEKLNRAFE